MVRSQQWYADAEPRNAYIHRAWMRRGTPEDAFSRPQVAIANTASELVPCNSHLDQVAQAVREGVLEAGGIPLNMPVMSLGETQMRPTAMLYRNLAAMQIEEMLRANPVDGAVLLGGCDKTIPALLMAASSVNLPAIVVPGGPMLTGHYRGRPLGCGTDVWKLVDSLNAGFITRQELDRSESCMIRSQGHCNTMGTASTMAIMAESLGMTLPGTAGIPAPDSRLLQAAREAGRTSVTLIREGRTPQSIMTRASFQNAAVALAATGGSTNALVHLLAIAGRLGVNLALDDFDRWGSAVPLLVNLQPAGKYLMDDLHRAGGLLAVLAEVKDLLDENAVTVTGGPLVGALSGAEVYDREVIASYAEPLQPAAGIAVLRGSLAPDGAVIKPAAATASLLRHRGRAVVFDSIEHLHARIEDPHLDVDEDSVLVLRGCGPRGFPGMPEAANLPIPSKLYRRGVRDLVRVSDARMSGTAFGTVVLHVAPEAAVHGPLALVRDGDPIVLDVETRRLDLDLPPREFARRKPSPAMLDQLAAGERGWERLYIDHVMQADRGADLDFMVGSSGHSVLRDSH